MLGMAPLGVFRATGEREFHSTHFARWRPKGELRVAEG